MAYRLSLFFIALVGVVAVALPAHAETGCVNYYGNDIATPSGFGAAQNLFTNPHELLVSVDCINGSPRLTVGSGASNEYVYKQAYIYASSTWQKLDLFSGSSLASDAWYAGSAATSTGLGGIPGSWTYVVGYVCQWNGAIWQCGCHDSACSAPAWQLQAFEGTDVPQPAATVGYTYKAMDIESWSSSLLDLGTQGRGFQWYTDGYSGEEGISNIQITITNGVLHLGGGGASGSNGIGTAANDITGQIPALYPPSGWVGNLFGPGYYIEATISFDPSGADASNWPGLWGNTFFSYFNNANVGGVELDWAGMRAGGLSVPAYDMALRDWTPGNDPIVASNNDATPLPAGWDWSAMHTYAVLCVPSEENGGQGYCQTYADGKPYYRLNWTALGQWSRLDATPIGFIMNPPDNSSLNVGAVRIFVKDASHVIRR